MKTWWTASHLQEETKYYLHLEASTRCNAGCPFCGRYELSSLNVKKELTQTDLTIDKLDRWLGPKVLGKLGQVLFCGNYGDPSMNPDLIDIIEYIRHFNPNVRLRINTNGGARNEKFWTDLAKALSKFNIPPELVFSIDGLETTNHLYRRNVKWSNLIRNVKAFTAAGGHAEWDYLVFEHNEHQVDDAVKLAKELSIKKFNVKSPTGLDDHGRKQREDRPVYDKEGNYLYSIKQAERFRNDDYEFVVKSEFGKKIKLNKDTFDPNNTSVDRDSYKYLDNFDIKCPVAEHEDNKGLYLTADGHFFPCCWLGYYSQIPFTSDVSNDFYNKIGGHNGCNLNNNSFDSIFKIWDKAFLNNWDNKVEDGKCLACGEQCGIEEAKNISKGSISPETGLDISTINNLI